MKIYQDKDLLRQAYAELGSAKSIAQKYGHNEKTILSWLHKHQIAVTPKGLGARKYYLDENFFSEIDSEEKAYWLGFIYADGCIFHGSSQNSYRLQINQKVEALGHLKRFLHSIKSNYPIRTKNIKVKGKECRTLALHIDNTKMAIDLIKHGVVVRKTYKDIFPIVKDNLFSHFIRGYFDGDGCISCKKSRKNSWRFEYVCKPAFASYTKSKLEKLGVTIAVYQTLSQEVVSLTISSQKDVKAIGEWLYRDATAYLDEKHDKFLKAMSYHSEMND